MVRQLVLHWVVCLDMQSAVHLELMKGKPLGYASELPTAVQRAVLLGQNSELKTVHLMDMH